MKQALIDIADSRFILLERAYAVNISHVLKLSNSKVYMDNGEEIPVSRNNYQEVKKIICELWEKRNV